MFHLGVHAGYRGGLSNINRAVALQQLLVGISEAWSVIPLMLVGGAGSLSSFRRAKYGMPPCYLLTSMRYSWSHDVDDEKSYIYIYICCRRGILANSEGESWPKKLPAAERSSWLRGILANIKAFFKRTFLARIPLLTCPDSPLWFSLSKTPFFRGARIARNHYFYSGFAQLRPIFRAHPRIRPKGLKRRVEVFQVSFEGGIFVHFHFFFWACNFASQLFATLADGNASNPYFCSVSGHVQLWKFRSARCAPGLIFCWLGAVFENWPQKRAKKYQTPGGK